MKDNRIKCPKCGRPLAFGCGYSAVAIECSCGCRTSLNKGRIVYEQSEEDEETWGKGRRRYGHSRL